MRPRPLITTSSQQHELAIGAQADGGFVPLHGDRNLWHAELAKLRTISRTRKSPDGRASMDGTPPTSSDTG